MDLGCPATVAQIFHIVNAGRYVRPRPSRKERGELAARTFPIIRQAQKTPVKVAPQEIPTT
jgi:hypothetical protein